MTIRAKMYRVWNGVAVEAGRSRLGDTPTARRATMNNPVHDVRVALVARKRDRSASTRVTNDQFARYF